MGSKLVAEVHGNDTPLAVLLLTSCYNFFNNFCPSDHPPLDGIRKGIDLKQTCGGDFNIFEIEQNTAN
jgi:hypothetical protein